MKDRKNNIIMSNNKLLYYHHHIVIQIRESGNGEKHGKNNEKYAHEK